MSDRGRERQIEGEREREREKRDYKSYKVCGSLSKRKPFRETCWECPTGSRVLSLMTLLVEPASRHHWFLPDNNYKLCCRLHHQNQPIIRKWIQSLSRKHLDIKHESAVYSLHRRPGFESGYYTDSNRGLISTILSQHQSNSLVSWLILNGWTMDTQWSHSSDDHVGIIFFKYYWTTPKLFVSLEPIPLVIIKVPFDR